MEKINLKHISTGELTYWPSDGTKLSDLVDFCLTKAVPQDFAVPKSCSDLPSDNTRVLITLISHVLKQPSLNKQ
jgi:hypothetical protein